MITCFFLNYYALHIYNIKLKNIPKIHIVSFDSNIIMFQVLKKASDISE